MGKLRMDFWKDWSGFYIHSFMLTKGLSGACLLVYALIYSFSIRGEGLCFVGNAIIAKRLGISRRTVDRAIETLFEMKLIKKQVSEDRCGYAVTDSEKNLDKEAAVASDKTNTFPSAEKEVIAEAPKKEKAPEKDTRTTPEYGKMSPEELSASIRRKLLAEMAEEKNKRAAMEEKPKSPPHASSFTGGVRMKENDPILLAEHLEDYEDYYENMHEGSETLPKHIFRFYGRKGYVRMTREQYKDLYSLVQPDALNCYIQRLEEICEKCASEFKRFPKSHYKLIRKWIDEDTYVGSRRK